MKLHMMMNDMNGKSSQLGELGAEAINEQIGEIRDKPEKEKIPLSKEMEEYTRANLRRVQDKLAKGEPVYPSDMAFIGKVKIWMSMPDWWRGKFESIEKLEGSGIITEARRRDIMPKQWFALLLMAGFKADRGQEKSG